MLGLLVALALAVAACGGSDSNNLGGVAGFSDGAVPAAADLLRDDVPVLVTINTDLDSLSNGSRPVR